MNKKFTFFAALTMLVTLTSVAAVPSGYYRTLVGKSGKDLKDAIQTLIEPHTVLRYNALWYYFYETDMIPNSNNQVWDMYSNNEYFFTSQSTASVSGMNKEHSFPKSWWGGGDVSDGFDAYTDLHHLVPSDGPANTAKSNWPLGKVYSASFDNNVSKVGTPVSGQGGGAKKVFEPDDEYKGDFARMYFYVATIYQNYQWVSPSGEWMLEQYDDNWKVFNNWSIDLLLQWARNDSVSSKEINRNDAVFRYQNNRNPFIDDPLLCEYIWGNRQGQEYDPTHGGTVNPDPEPTVPTIITPTQGTLLEFGDVKLGESATLTLYVKGLNLTSNLSLQLYRWQYQMFSIPTTTIDYTQVCTDEGYPLEITYTPTYLGEHKAKLLIKEGGLTSNIGVDIIAHCIEGEDEFTGDFNGDGIVDVEDMNILINYILNHGEGVVIFEDQDPDLTGDGMVDVEDVNFIINIILKHE